jgi:hypothetical protein
MRMHVEASYVHDARSRIRSTNEWKSRPAPRFYLGRTAEGHLWRFRADLPDALGAELDALCRREPVVAALPATPLHRDELVRLLASHAPVEWIGAGPAYWIPWRMVASGRSVEIGAANADLLRSGFEDWLEDVPHCQPFHAVSEGGRAVSLCASVRITAAAHAAGVETLPAFRRRGHAVAAVAGWADAVRRLGATPLYSTSWENVASQSVAARLGLPLFGVDFHVT